MGEYGVEPQGLVCDATCLVGCFAYCLSDLTSPAMDAIAISIATHVNTAA